MGLPAETHIYHLEKCKYCSDVASSLYNGSPVCNAHQSIIERTKRLYDLTERSGVEPLPWGKTRRAARRSRHWRVRFEPLRIPQFNMAISFLAAGTAATNSTAGTSNAPGIPAGCTNLTTRMYAFLAINGDKTASLNIPTGWTKLGAQFQTSGATLAVYAKWFATGDGAPTFTWTSTNKNTGIILAYNGLNLTTPEDVAISFAGSTATTTPTSPTATALTMGACRIHAEGRAGTGTSTPDWRMVERADQTTSTSSPAALAIADQLGMASDAAGTRNDTVSSAIWMAATLWLRPATPTTFGLIRAAFKSSAGSVVSTLTATLASADSANSPTGTAIIATSNIFTSIGDTTTGITYNAGANVMALNKAQLAQSMNASIWSFLNNAVTGAISVVANRSGTDSMELWVGEFKGVATASALDQTGQGNGATGLSDAVATAGVTASGQKLAVTCISGGGNPDVFTADANYVLRRQQTSGAGGFEPTGVATREFAGGGVETSTWGAGTSSTWNGVIVTYTSADTVSLAASQGSNSSVSGALSATKFLSGSLAAQSGKTAALSLAKFLSGSPAAQSSQASALAMTKKLSGNPAGQSGQSSALSLIKKPLGTASGSGTAGGALSLSKFLRSTPGAQSALLAALISRVNLAASIAPHSTTSAYLLLIGQLIAALHDNFNDNVFDSALWTAVLLGSASVAESVQRLDLSVSGGSASASVRSKNGWDMVSGSAFVQLVVPASDPGSQARFGVAAHSAGNWYDPAAVWITQDVTSGNLGFNYADGLGGELPVGTPVAFDPAVHRWLLINFDGTTLKGYTSTDGITFTQPDIDWAQTLTDTLTYNSMRFADIWMTALATFGASGASVSFDNLDIALRMLASTIGAQSVLTAALGKTVRPAGSASAQSLQTGQISLTKRLSATVVGASAPSAVLSMTKLLSALVHALSAETTSLSVTHSLRGGPVAQSVLTASLLKVVQPASAIHSQSATPATLRMTNALRSQIQAQSADQAAVSLIKKLASLSIAQSGQVSALRMTKLPAGSVTSISTVAASLALIKRLSTLAHAQSGDSADLTLVGITLLTAQIHPQSGVLGALALTKGLRANVVDQSSLSGTPAVVKLLVGNSASLGAVTGQLRLTKLLQAISRGQVVDQATLSTVGLNNLAAVVGARSSDVAALLTRHDLRALVASAAVVTGPISVAKLPASLVGGRASVSGSVFAAKFLRSMVAAVDRATAALLIAHSLSAPVVVVGSTVGGSLGDVKQLRSLVGSGSVVVGRVDAAMFLRAFVVDASNVRGILQIANVINGPFMHPLALTGGIGPILLVGDPPGALGIIGDVVVVISTEGQG